MKIEELKKYKKILIAGYGKEGQVTEAFLQKIYNSALIDVVDMENGPNYLDSQTEYDLVIKTPGIHKEFIKIPYTTATNIFFANVKNTIIGVTGTKGKSTTTTLIYEILKADGKKVRIVGNIGKPMIAELMTPIDKDEIFVCELSSYQLDDIRYSPHISLVVNLFPEHMNYHGSAENYYKAKKNIIACAKENDYFVFNPDFPLLKKWTEDTRCISIPFTETLPFEEKYIPLLGKHNRDNLRGAITVAHILGVPDTTILNAVKNFKALPHRLEYVGEFKGIKFYDDAISTTPESTIAAINSLPNIKTIFLGGLNRGYDFKTLIPHLINNKIENIVLFPESGKNILEHIKMEPNYKPQYIETSKMKEAVEFAFNNTPSGSICLLSTASPSYSIWKNFEEKGNEFQNYIKKLGSA